MFDKIPTLTATVNNRRFVREWSLIYSRHNTALFERNITVEIKLKENTSPRCAALCTSATFLFTSTFMILYDLRVALKKVDDGTAKREARKVRGTVDDCENYDPTDSDSLIISSRSAAARIF